MKKQNIAPLIHLQRLKQLLMRVLFESIYSKIISNMQNLLERFELGY